MIVGVDEVGRGCWAGPLCVGAVALGPTDTEFKDSKLLTPKRRRELALDARHSAASIGIGWVSAKYIDTHGLSAGLKAAAEAAVKQITVPFDEIIIDGTIRLVDDPRVTLLKKADQLINAVSAASIVAKVARDQYMQWLDSHFAGYGFAQHVGYGTAKHRAALQNLGPSSIHRMSFLPLQNLSSKHRNPQTKRIQKNAIAQKINSGTIAESQAVKYLENLGCTIVATNWKTRWCEIDIIASKGHELYFVEVKYRKSDQAGRGLEYITKTKQQHMQFAAELWLQRNATSGMQPHLAALELSGGEFAVTAWVPSIVLLPHSR